MHQYSRIIICVLLLCASCVYADIERVSVSSNGEQANTDTFMPSISADGRFVAFVSEDGNLVEGDTNGVRDVFLHDRDSGITERISLSPAGQQTVNPLNSGSYNPSISADGRFVAYQSDANNLIPGDTTKGRDIFVYNRITGLTEQVSVSSSGIQGSGGDSTYPSISADGRFVAFQSDTNNLVEGDTNNFSDIFVHDRSTGRTRRVNIPTTGGQANNWSGFPTISANGRIVAFVSRASDIVEADTNGFYDVFVRDLHTKTTERVNVSSTGEQTNDETFGFSFAVSSDGRFVSFSSLASNLVEDDDNFGDDVFVRDRTTEKTHLVSISSTGEQAINGNGSISQSISHSMSSNGRFVTFSSTASNLVEGDTNGARDIFIHDRLSGLTKRLNVSSTGEQAIGSFGSGSFSALVSGDGRYVEFASSATNLVDDDSNNVIDIFVTDNPLRDFENDLIIVEKKINNEARKTPFTAAQLLSGSQYRQSYSVTNASTTRLYQVQVFEDGQLVCNFYALDPGLSKQRCNSIQTVLEGDQHVSVLATARVSQSSESITGKTDAYYKGHINPLTGLNVVHSISDTNADTEVSAITLDGNEAEILFLIHNTSEIELYQIKTYQDSVSPVNSGWVEQCKIGRLKPGEIRYCKRNVVLTEPGLNKVIGRAQGRNAMLGATGVVNASNPTYFVVP